jgi:hypothetical protein
MTAEEQLVIFTLIDQVQNALKSRLGEVPGICERDVRTVITRPMWNVFCRAIGVPENSTPTEWLGLHNTIRVAGSETIVIESDEWWSASAIIPP